MTPNFWQQRNFISYCLTPFAAIYRIIIFIRRLLFQRKIKKTIHFTIPIIVVGNITVGGTGKTPLVIWLANYLREQGFKPGIVSRGYGGKNVQYPCEVTAKSDPQQVGDEAVLVARNTQCPMMVDPNRVRAVEQLLKLHNCNVVISDDGLQHYALGRDVEIVVIDGARGFGNGFCLPAGPLREPIKRLQKVDFVVVNRTAKDYVGWIRPKAVIHRSMVDYALRANPPYNFNQVNNPTHIRDIHYFKNKKIHAVAGIGNPQRFFNTLREMGLNVIEHPFPDHYHFQIKDFVFAKASDIILMTEKDAVKCEQFADVRFWYLPVRAELPQTFGVEIIDIIKVL